MGLPQVFFLKKHKHILKLQGYIFILCEIAICWSLLFEERCATQQSWCISWNINSIEGEGRGQYTWDFCLKWKEFKLFTKWHPWTLCEPFLLTALASNVEGSLWQHFLWSSGFESFICLKGILIVKGCKWEVVVYFSLLCSCHHQDSTLGHFIFIRVVLCPSTYISVSCTMGTNALHQDR